MIEGKKENENERENVILLKAEKRVIVYIEIQKDSLPT
jgi:hypothetical protein